MYARLIFRGIQRHRKKGKRLFVLIACSSAVIIFLLTFKTSFTVGYVDMSVGAISGHLQVLHPDSPQLKDESFMLRESLPLITIDAEAEAFVKSIKGVEASGRVIDTWTSVYNLDGEQNDGFHLIGVPAGLKRTLYPVAKVLDGSDDITWTPGSADVNLARPRLQEEFGQVNPDHSQIKPGELRVKGDALESFKKKLITDFPALFPNGYSGNSGNKAFFADWSAALGKADLADMVKEGGTYDWKLDDAMAAIADNDDASKVKFLNKRLFKALYDAEIGPVREAILTGDRVTLQIPPARTKGELSTPVSVPAKYTGFVDTMPLYGAGASAFMDLGALQSYMGLKADECLSYMIRLDDIADTDSVKGIIAEYLRSRGLPWVVADYHLLGKLYMPTTMAIGVVCDILSIVLSAIVVILVTNMVMLSVIKRRQEIGTAIALGLSPAQNIAVMLGESFLIVTVSWAAGCLVGALIVAAAREFGVPGMIFFPGGKLFLRPDPGAYVVSWLMITPISVLAAFLPLIPIARTMPVDLLKEAR